MLSFRHPCEVDIPFARLAQRLAGCRMGHKVDTQEKSQGKAARTHTGAGRGLTFAITGVRDMVVYISPTQSYKKIFSKRGAIYNLPPLPPLPFSPVVWGPFWMGRLMSLVALPPQMRRAAALPAQGRWRQLQRCARVLPTEPAQSKGTSREARSPSAAAQGT